MASEAITAGCGTGTGCGTRFAMGRAARWNCWPGCGFAPGPLKGACFGAQLSPRAVGSLLLTVAAVGPSGVSTILSLGSSRKLRLEVSGFRVAWPTASGKWQKTELSTVPC